MTDPANDHIGIPLRMGESYLRLKMDGRFVTREFNPTDQVSQSSHDTPEAKDSQDFPIAQVTQGKEEAQPARDVQGSQAGPSLQDAQETQISQHPREKRDTHGTQDVQGRQDTQRPKALRTRSKTKPRKMYKPLRSSRILRPALNLETGKMPKVSRTFGLYSTSSTPWCKDFPPKTANFNGLDLL